MEQTHKHRILTTTQFITPVTITTQITRLHLRLKHTNPYSPQITTQEHRLQHMNTDYIVFMNRCKERSCWQEKLSLNLSKKPPRTGMEVIEGQAFLVLLGKGLSAGIYAKNNNCWYASVAKTSYTPRNNTGLCHVEDT